MALGWRCGTVGGTTTGTTNTVAMTIPTSGSGGTTAAGDVAVVCIASTGSNTYTAAPSGFTQRALSTNAQGNITGAIYTKTLVAGDINVSLSWTLNAAAGIAATIDVISGAAESSFTYSSMSVGTGTSITTPTATITANGWDLGVWIGAITSGAAFTFTRDGTYSAGETRATAVVSGSNRTIGTGWKSVPAGGSTVGTGCTFSASTNRNAAFSVNVAPSGDATVAGVVAGVTLAAPAGSVPTIGGVTAGITVAAPAGAVTLSNPISALVDDFSGTLDTVQKWKNSTGSPSTSGGICNVPSGSVLISDDYDATGGAVYAKVTTGSDSALVRLVVGATTTGVYSTKTAGGFISFHRVQGGDTTVAGPLTYDPVAMLYQRFRESGGTLFWDTSPDGSTWTNQGSTTYTFAVTAMRFQVQAGTSTTVDNVNTNGSATVAGVVAGITLAAPAGAVSTPRPKYGTLIDDFATLNTTTVWTHNSAGACSVSGNVCSITGNAKQLGSDLFDLTGSSIYAKVTPPTGAGHDNYWYFGFFPSNSDGATMYLRIDSPTNGLECHYTDTTAAGGADHAFTGAALTYDPVAHAWLKWRESGGTITVSYSADGVNWTDQFTATPSPPIDLTAIATQFRPNQTGGGTMTVEHVNVPQSANATITGVVSGVTLSAPAGTVNTNVSVTGVTAGITLAAPAGAVHTSATISGVISAITSAAPAGSVTGTVNVAGVTVAVTLTAPAGSVATAVFGAVTAITATAPAGTVHTNATLTGVVAGIALAAPPGSLAVSSSITGVGKNISFTAPAGTVTGSGSATVTGAVSAVTVVAPVGFPAVSVPGPVSAVALAAPAGSVTTTVSIAGVSKNIALVAPAGAVSEGATISGVPAGASLSAPTGAVGITTTGVSCGITLAAPAGSVASTSTLAGPACAVTLTAPVGAVHTGSTLPGATAPVTLTAPAGVVTITGDFAVPGVPAAITLASAAGTVSTGVNVSGVTAAASLSAPAGAVGVGPTIVGPTTGITIAAITPGRLLTNLFPNPSCESGGTGFTTNLTSVVLGSTDFSPSGTGSAKVTVGGSPNLTTTAFPTVNNTDIASNTHNRYAASTGDTFDLLFTVKAHAANTQPVTVRPTMVGYWFNGSVEGATAGFPATFFATVLLQPGEVRTVANRVTVPAGTDPVDGILPFFYLYGATTAATVAAGSVVYLDSLVLARNVTDPLSVFDYVDGSQARGAWSGTTNQSSSVAPWPMFPGVRIDTPGPTGTTVTAAPAGSLSTNVVLTGASCNLTVSAVNGTVGIAESAPTTGLTTAAPAGGFVTDANLSGPVAPIIIAAIPGGAPVITPVVVTGETADLTIAAPAGSISIDQMVAGEAAAITLAAIAGKAGNERHFTFAAGKPTVAWKAGPPQVAWAAHPPETAWEAP